VAFNRADLQGQPLGYFGVRQALADQAADALLLRRHRGQGPPVGRRGKQPVLVVCVVVR
jgi:hypothetical protein